MSPVPSGVRLTKGQLGGRGGANTGQLTLNTWGAHSPTPLTSRGHGIVTCIFQLQKLKLKCESLADKWQCRHSNPVLSGSRAVSHPTSHTLSWDSW